MKKPFKLFLLVVIITSLIFGWLYYKKSYNYKIVTQTEGNLTTDFITDDMIEKNTPDFYNVPINKIQPEEENSFMEPLDTLLLTGNLKALDVQIVKFITSKKIPRNKKISTLLSLLYKYETDEVKFLYILDSLATLKPIEITDQILAIYKPDMSNDRKVHILSLLEEATNIKNPSKQTPEQVSYINTNISKIQDFVSQQINIEQNPLIQYNILSSYTRIIPTEQKTQVLLSLLTGQYKNIPKEETGKLAASLIMDTPSVQDSMILTLLDEESQFNPAVYERIIAELSDESINIKLTPYAIDSIDSYLKKNGKRTYYYQNDGALDATKYWLSIKATAKLESYQSNHTLEEVLRDRVYSPNSSALEKANILLSSDNQTRELIQQHPDFMSLSTILKDTLVSHKFIDSERSLITSALSDLGSSP